MTHEELVEKVAEELWMSHQLSAGETNSISWETVSRTSRYEWVVDEFRSKARGVIKITGEACRQRIHAIAHSTISERELLDAIKSLTQGKETPKGGAPI